MNTNSLVSTDQAAPAAGPYSQATRTEQFVFASGQLPIDPVSGNIPDGIEQQTRQSLANLSAVLEAGGASFATVMKTTVFLDRKSTRLNSSHTVISYAVFCLKKKKTKATSI